MERNVGSLECQILLALTFHLDTKEGLETCFALSYYTRIRLVTRLLPLLRQSSGPRVLSVLNGGKEEALNEQDLGLDQSWSSRCVIKHTTTMTTLMFERLAKENQGITFMHAYPGLVKTDIIAGLSPLRGSGLVWIMTLAFVRGLAAIILLVFGMSVEECGERQAFLLTSDSYGPGAFRINSTSDQVLAPGILKRYREQSWSDRIWNHTTRTIDTALAMGKSAAPR